MKKRIKFSLIPQSAFGHNIRAINQTEWDRISLFIRSHSNGICAICGEQVDIERMDAHEVWKWDKKKRKQVLQNIIPICKECHHTIHIGFTIHELGDVAYRKCLGHYCKLNQCSEKRALKDLQKANIKQMKRSTIYWKMDISNLDSILNQYTGFSPTVQNDMIHT